MITTDEKVRLIAIPTKWKLFALRQFFLNDTRADKPRVAFFDKLCQAAAEGNSQVEVEFESHLEWFKVMQPFENVPTDELVDMLFDVALDANETSKEKFEIEYGMHGSPTRRCRTGAAENALKAYPLNTGDPKVDESVIQDLITDLLHLAYKYGHNHNQIMHAANKHFYDETHSINGDEVTVTHYLEFGSTTSEELQDFFAWVLSRGQDDYDLLSETMPGAELPVTEFMLEHSKNYVNWVMAERKANPSKTSFQIVGGGVIEMLKACIEDWSEVLSARRETTTFDVRVVTE